MSALVPRETLVWQVSKEISWMVSKRLQKFDEGLFNTMSINPLLMPILYDLHSAGSFNELGELLLAGHLMVGHTTSFGKLIDEKILPTVFGAEKLNAKYRAENPPLTESCFNEIDHLVRHPGKKPALLSLKASRWTINLTGAKGLNSAFAEILHNHSDKYEEIVVGVFNGRQENLSDKYDILRGINRGKKHDVVDLTSNVQVLAGRNFWAWINGDEPNTQDWLLEGILEGLRLANCREKGKKSLEEYKRIFSELYKGNINADGSVNWQQVLTDING